MVAHTVVKLEITRCSIIFISPAGLGIITFVKAGQVYIMFGGLGTG